MISEKSKRNKIFEDKFKNSSDDESLELVKILLKNKEDINQWFPDEDSDTRWDLLMMACAKTKFKTIEFLLKNGANPNRVSGIGSTALTFFVGNFYWEKELMKETFGSLVTVIFKEKEVSNQKKSLKILKLFKEYGADFNLRESDDGMVPFEYLFVKMGIDIFIDEEIFDFLLNETDIKLREKWNEEDQLWVPLGALSALMHSEKNFTVERVKKILDKGYDINKQYDIHDTDPSDFNKNTIYKSLNFVFSAMNYTQEIKKKENYKESLDFIFNNCEVNWNVVDSEGLDVLASAIVHKNNYMLDMVLEKSDKKKLFDSKEKIEFYLNEAIKSNYKSGILKIIKLNKLSWNEIEKMNLLKESPGYEVLTNKMIGLHKNNLEEKVGNKYKNISKKRSKI